MTKETYARYLVEFVGFSIAKAATKAGVSEYWLNLCFPESRKVTASNKYRASEEDMKTYNQMGGR